ncbi:MAG TPA: FAD-dependent oxidoreductase [Actinospica sp.]|nr:FAD-dependent oxidoreductase [Actinospica sp.]
MSTQRRVLIIGGGTAGNAAAILLRRSGIAVDLIEAKTDWGAGSGSGITVQGNALRVLRELGVWDRVQAAGFAFDEVGLASPDGHVFHVQRDIRTGGDDLPATIGMQRAQLQAILIDAVRESGTRVRLDVTVEEISQGDSDVEVRFSDGTPSRYDLVIGADGLNSQTRALLGITDKPEPTGMAIWRVAAPRPASVTRTDLAYGGPCFIAGYCPTSENTIYAYLVEGTRERSSVDPTLYPETMRKLAAGYGGAWVEIAASIIDDSVIDYRRFDRLLLEGSWHRGRVVLIGDAAHCCPPTLAQGAAISLEDALVLAELLNARETWDEQLLQDYYTRRIDRVRAVVDASVQLGQWQLDGVRDADAPGLIARTFTMLKERP